MGDGRWVGRKEGRREGVPCILNRDIPFYFVSRIRSPWGVDRRDCFTSEDNLLLAQFVEMLG